MAQATIQDVRRESQQGARSAAKAKQRRFEVDLWATSINDVEIGIMKHTQHQAKSDQFTKDMDVIGQIIEDGERTGLLAYRKGLWREETGAKRRLVMKLFSDKMNWRGTLDMMIGRSLQLTHGADGVPVTAYSMNLARHEQVIQMERSADKWILSPEKFSFTITDDSGSQFYKLRQNIFSIGQDYTILDQENRKIGLLDGKLFSVGGFWRVKIDAKHASSTLANALQLFCGMLRFNKEARRHVNQLTREMCAGKMAVVSLDRYEKDLYMNPRSSR